MKKCIRCLEEKSIGHFYKHKEMADGLLTVCKDCVKSRVKKRAKKLSENPEWVEKEKQRHREKFHRLSKNWKQPTKEYKFTSTKKYRGKYPEKYSATSSSQKIPCPEGFHRHHWSYHPDNAKDVLIIEKEAHYLLHRHFKYDQERMAYRNSDGLLLNRQDHVNFIINNGFNIENPF